MRDVGIKTLLTGSNTYLWQKQGETNVRDSFVRREEKYTHPPVMKLLSSSCFPRNRRRGFGSKVMIEKESFISSHSRRDESGCWWDSLNSVVCVLFVKWDHEAIVVDVVIVGDVTHNHCDWLMSLFAVWKFRKLNLHLKINTQACCFEK